MIKIEALRRTRNGFETERKWHRFLIDAYTGGGGFQGRIKCPESELGSAAACYADCAEPTYLDRHQRENDGKFKRRRDIAHYLNYVEPLTDLKVDFALGKPATVENLPDQIAKWRKDVDGHGQTFDEARRKFAKRAAILGWVPTIVDMPEAVDGVVTQAQAQEAGITPRLVGLYPANLTEWFVREGILQWVKVRTDFVERSNPFADEDKYSRVDVWTPDGVESFVIRENDVSDEGQRSWPTPRPIPLAVLRHKEAEDDPLIGLPMHGPVSLEARRLYNLISALDENIDSQGFALLVLAEEQQPDTGGPEGEDDRTIGTENAITIDPKSTREHYYLAPPASVAQAFETRIEATVREIYRMGRVEFTRPQGSQNESGIARRQAFVQTNNAIADFAACIAAWEQSVYVHVGRALGLEEAKLAAIRVVAPTEFGVDDLEGDIQRALDAITAKLGATATKKIKSRLVQVLLPRLDEKTIATIEDELDAQATAEESARAFARTALNQAPGANLGQDAAANRPGDPGSGAQPAGANGPPVGG